MPFSLDNLDAVVRHITHPERLRDLLTCIFREEAMRHSGNRTERTGFETATEEELQLAFLRTVNEILVRWGRLKNQLIELGIAPVGGLVLHLTVTPTQRS